MKKSEDNSYIKVLLVSIMFAVVLYSTYGFTIKPEAHAFDFYQAFTRSMPFMIVLFILGFTYFVPKKDDKKEIKVVEEANL